jgi:DNA repair and recombination protein RAD54 and RAD54-like protein
MIEPEQPRKARKCKAEGTENLAPPLKESKTDHEAMILKLLSKPFKVPIPDYIPERTNKSLGLKRTLIRR